MKTRSKNKSKPVYEEELITFVDEVEGDTICPVCKAEFLDEDDLKIHLMQVHENEITGNTICKFCEGVFCSMAEFVRHLIFDHLENLAICYYCYRAFTDSVALEQHTLKHCAVKDDSSMACSQCSLIFTNRTKLQTHEYSDHKNSEDGVMLNDAFALLSSFLNMPIPKFLDSVSKNKDFYCIQCNHISYDIVNYVDHLRRLNCKSIACDKCYVVYKSKNGVAHHFRKHPECHNYNDGVLRQCFKCDKVFSLEDLVTHEKFCEAIKCSTCNAIFTKMHDLADHRLKIHNTSLTVSLETCKFCLKQFVGKFNLKKHVNRAHKNRALYKYPCTHCGILYMHPSKLFAHFYTKHKTIEPYTCLICNKKFRLRRKFTIHIKIVHNSVGFVEFDSNLHVIFTNKKSENPYLPQSPKDAFECNSVEASDDNSESQLDKKSNEIQEKINPSKQLSTEVTVDNGKIIEAVALVSTQDTTISGTTDNTALDSNKVKLLKVRSEISKGKTGTQKQGTPIKQIKQPLKTDVKYTKLPLRKRRKRKAIAKLQSRAKRARKSENDGSDTLSINLSDEEPLSNVRETLLKKKDQLVSSSKEETKPKNKSTRLTCAICNKYCFTVQNYHHHMSLHEKSKLKRCIKCRAYFKSRKELKTHIAAAHSSSKLTETLRSLLEKRRNNQPALKSSSRPAETIKSLLEQRKKSHLLNLQNTPTNKFRKTIKKVNITDECTATITPMSDHGISVKNFIENFRPDAGDTVSISNSVTIKTINEPTNKQPFIKMHKFKEETTYTVGLRPPVKFNDTPDEVKGKVSVKLVQQLITKPKVINFTLNERIPAISPPPETDNEYCNMYSDETDYTQYKNDSSIPEVAQEVMLRDADDIPKTKQLAQEIIIPNIPDKYGGVRIGHLLPDAPFYKIVKVKKLLKGQQEAESEEEEVEKNIQLPDGTQLVTVKNPFSHLIPNHHLQEILKANKNRYYTPKVRNIGKALAKALVHQKKPGKRRSVKESKDSNTDK